MLPVLMTQLQNKHQKQNHMYNQMLCHHPYRIQIITSESSEKDHTSVSNSSPFSRSTTSESFSISTLSEQLDLEDVFGAYKSYALMKLVGNNLDKEVVPREMLSDYQKCSLHYFYAYAVKDRIDLSEISDQKVQPDFQSIQLTELLPTGDDEDTLRRNCTILMSC